MLTEVVLPVNEVLSRSPGCGNVRAEPLDTGYCLALIATCDKLMLIVKWLYMLLLIYIVFYTKASSCSLYLTFITCHIICIKLTI